MLASTGYRQSAFASCSLVTMDDRRFTSARERARGLAIGALFVASLVDVAWAFDSADWTRQGWTVGYEAGVARSQSERKPAFLYFDARWCSWCQQYHRDVLDRPDVRATLARDFVRVVVDYDARPDLMQQFGGEGLPFTVVLTPEGGVLSRFVGVMPAPDLIAHLGTFQSRTSSDVVTASKPVVVHRVDALDAKGFEAFRSAWLRHLEPLYALERGTLSGQYDTGTTYRHTALLTWLYLMDDGRPDARRWRQRAVQAAKTDRQRLWDAVDGGFFNFVDPTRGDYVESSKLLEVNAWMTAWQARAGQHDTGARLRARAAHRFLMRVLWDRERGGFWQAQRADNAFYALPPVQRARRAPPPLERVKRADTNAQAAWALLLTGRHSGSCTAIDTAAATLDFVLRDMVRDARVYHVWRAGTLMSPGLPHTMFWVLAAGAELERARPSPARRARLHVVATEAARWLGARMQQAEAPVLDNELAGLVALVADEPEWGLPPGARDWALRQLRIESETTPDEVVPGLWAWERRLDAVSQ